MSLVGVAYRHHYTRQVAIGRVLPSDVRYCSQFQHEVDEETAVTPGDMKTAVH